MVTARGSQLKSGGSASARWTVLLEVAFWLAAIAAIFLLPRRLLLLNEIAILALFAMSLDLVLGYAGIVSLGHAAFFGLGAYTAGLMAKHFAVDPLVGIAAAAATAGLLGFLTSFLVLRGSDLTRLIHGCQQSFDTHRIGDLLHRQIT